MKNQKRINIMVGRFQPITRGHVQCLETAYKRLGVPSVLCMIETKVSDERHPFLSYDLIPLYKSLLDSQPYFEDIILIKNADIVTISEKCQELGYEVVSWTCGTDRYEAYSKMAEKYTERANLPSDFQVIEIPRTDEDISATKLRKALKDGNQKEFLAGFPKLSLKTSLRANYYEILREKILSIKESILSSDLNVTESAIREWLEKYIQQPDYLDIFQEGSKYYVENVGPYKEILFYNGCESLTNGLFQWRWKEDENIHLYKLNITDLSGCGDQVGILEIMECPKLRSLYGAPKEIKTLKIEYNDNLVNLRGLQKSKIHILDLYRNKKLVSLNGLGKSCFTIIIEACPQLQELDLKVLPKKLYINIDYCPRLKLTPSEQRLATASRSKYSPI